MLFMNEKVVGASGRVLPWKIYCDDFTDEDWHWAAKRAKEIIVPFGKISEVIGVPRGGLKFAHELEKLVDLHPSGRRIICDDVLTTGGSIKKISDRPKDIAIVLFNRCPNPPPYVCSIWDLNPSVFNRGEY